MTFHVTSSIATSIGVQSPGERAWAHLGEDLKDFGSEGMRTPGLSR